MPSSLPRATRTLLLMAALLTSLVALVGCGEKPDNNNKATANSTDAGFASAMIPHHRSAVDMAKLLAERSSRPELQQLSKDIIASQSAEIETLEKLHQQFLAEGLGEGDIGLSHHDMGMASDEPALGDYQDTDRAFLVLMIPHHQGAVKMAQIELDKGENPQLRQLAQAIIAAQQAEIAKMKGWYRSWYGGDEASDPGPRTQDSDKSSTTDDDHFTGGLGEPPHDMEEPPASGGGMEEDASEHSDTMH